MHRKTRLYDYTDYREFLKASYREIQKRNQNFSQRAWALKIGLSSAARLTTILNGERNLGPKLAEKFVEYFQFNDYERKYFLDLIKLEKYKNDPVAANAVYKKLVRHSLRDRFTELPPHIFNKISNWYFDTIREFTKISGFKGEPAWIKEHLAPELSNKVIKEAIDLLLDCKILVRNENGKLIATQDNHIGEEAYKQKEIRDAMGRKFQMCNNLFIKGEMPPHHSKFQTLTFPANSKKIDKAKELIDDFWKSFATIMEDEEDGDHVYMLNIQYLPITREVKKQ